MLKSGVVAPVAARLVNPNPWGKFKFLIRTFVPCLCGHLACPTNTKRCGDTRY